MQEVVNKLAQDMQENAEQTNHISPPFDPVKNGEQIKQQIEQAIEAEIECIVWDLETTGFVAPECKILEIGCFIVNGENVEHKHWVLNNVGHEIPEKITELTGITQAIIDAEGRDPKECLLEFLPLFKRCKKNVTHNGVRFDIPFLLDYAAHVLEFTPEQKMAVANLIRSTAYDTAVAYKAKAIGYEPQWRESYLQFAGRVMNTRAFGVKFNLGNCCDEAQIDRSNVVQHRALGDVDLTYRLYKTQKNSL